MSSQPIITVLAEAQRAHLTIKRGENGRLVVRGPRTARELVGMILARKADVLQLLALYRGEVIGLDWQHATIDDPAPCMLCGKPALCRDPYDQRPCHKTCAEQSVAPARSEHPVPHAETTEATAA